MARDTAEVLVFDDVNGNGVFDANEVGTPGVTVTLTGGEDDPNNIDLCETPGTPIVPRIAVTDENGEAFFDDVGDGCYAVTLSNLPGGRVTTSATPGAFAGEGNVDASVVDMIGFNPDRFGEGGLIAAFGLEGGEPQTGSLAGRVFFDANHNGVRDPDFDYGIASVTILLSGTDDFGNPVQRSTVTGSDGRYLFDNLVPGVYQIREVQPRVFIDGRDSVGTLGGTLSNDRISNIRVRGGDQGDNYDFGELSSRRCKLHVSVVSARDRARRNGTLGQRGPDGEFILPTLPHRRGPLISRFVPTLAGGRFTT